MAIEKIDPIKPVAPKRQDPVIDHGDHGGGPKRHGSRKGHMVLRTPHIKRRRHQHVRLRAGVGGNHFRTNGIRPDEPVGAMLLS